MDCQVDELFSAVGIVFLLLVTCAPLTAEDEDAERTSHESVESTPEAPFFPGIHDDLTGRGLVDFRDQFPLAKLHLQLPSATPPGLESGASVASVQFDWANTLARSTFHLVDAETYTLRLGYWHALRRDVYLGAETAVEARDGGVLDGFIDGFHDRFDINVPSRNASPKDEYQITVVDDRRRVRELDRGVGLGNTTLKAHWIFMEGEQWRPTLSVQALLNLPTSTHGFGSRGVDLGLAFLAQKRLWHHLYLYGIFGGTYLTDRKTEGLRYTEFNGQLSVGVEIVLWWESMSLVGQYVLLSPLLDGPDGLDQRRQYVGGALKWQAHPKVNLTLGMMENLPSLKVSTDVTFITACEFRF